MRLSTVAGLVLSLAACNLLAQLTDVDPDWKEGEVPAPPAFKTDGLIFLEMPRHMSSRVGIDPETLRITADGLVRYVVVTVSPGGAANASYEGIRCLTGEVKAYARYGVSGQWVLAPNPQWTPMNGNQRSPHAIALARQGACIGRSASAHSPAEIVGRLKSVAGDHSKR